MSRFGNAGGPTARDERLHRASASARTACAKVMEDPRSSEAWKMLGDAAEKLELVDEARMAFRRARELDPNFLRLPPAKVDRQPSSRDVEAARRAVTAIVLRHGRSSKISLEDEEKLKAEGNAFFKAGKYEDAIKSYTRAIGFCPEVASLYGNRSAAYYMLKMFQEAALDAIKACKVDPFYLKGYSRASKAYLCLGDVERAKDQLEQAQAKGADVTKDMRSIFTVEKALSVNGSSMRPEDERLIERAFEIAPNIEQFKVAMGRVLLSKGKHQEALALCKGLKVDGSKYAAEILSVRAEASYATGDTEAAQRYFAQALAIDPKNRHAKNFMNIVQMVERNKHRGNLAFKHGKWEEACQHYTAAMNVDTNLKNNLIAQCACNRAAALLKLEDYEGALSDCTLATEIDDKYTKAYLRRGNINMELDYFQDAFQDFQKVQQLDPQTPGIRQLIEDARAAMKKQKILNFYELLEVCRTATEIEIKKAYKKAALKYHPDKNAHRTPKEQRAADRKFKHLQDAYSILLDKQKRALYDRGYSAEDIEAGVDDVAEDFGGMNMGNGHGRGSGGSTRTGGSSSSTGRNRYQTRR